MNIGNDPNAVTKLDNQAIEGLDGVVNSLGYKVEEIEKHFHNREKWFGLAGTPVGETHRADRMAGGIQPFQLIVGNDDFGAWVQILGSDDTPIQSDMQKFDFHRILVTTTNSTNPFIIQMVDGESSEIAAKIAAEQFTEVPFISATNNNDSGIENIKTSRVQTGSKIWARAACIGSSGSIINFYYGLHEYKG